MTVCWVLECVYNDREDDPQCNFVTINGGIDIDEDRKCVNFTPDKQYRIEQFNIRLGISSSSAMLEARNYENMISNYAPELRRIIQGEMASKLFNSRTRINLREIGILEKKGRRTTVSPRAQIKLLLEWEEKVSP